VDGARSASHHLARPDSDGGQSVMFQPGQDTNYPTSSGNVPAAFLQQQWTIGGLHITFAMIAIVIALLIVWNMAKKRR
jgi:hypothetical protein